LGGIEASRIRDCEALGFDGVAALGGVWNAPDPVAAFRALQSACQEVTP
jgi:thiamine-phosphate pyrophosphorylase